MIKISELDQDTLQEIARYRDMGYELLEFPIPGKPDDVVARIDRSVRQIKAKDIEMPEQEQVIALGVLLGEQYIRAFSWHWSEVLYEGEETALTRVLSPDNAVGNNPIGWVNELLTSDKAVNILTNFYSVTTGKLPAVQPGQAVDFY